MFLSQILEKIHSRYKLIQKGFVISLQIDVFDYYY